MNAEPVSLLLCTNGCEAARPALRYGVHLAELLKLPVVLLGVLERKSQEVKVLNSLADTAQRLEKAGIGFQQLLERGRGSIVISRYTQMGNYLTVVGPLGRPVWRRVVQGRSFRRLQSRIETPIFYVSEERWPIRRILLCMGGLGFAQAVENLCLNLAIASGADLALLHVVEPVTLDYPIAHEIQENWEEILETDTPQGRNLSAAMQRIREAGLDASLKIRHGNIVHEILDEVRGGDYDLVGMGSAYSAHSLRHLYMPNVTAEIAEEVDCPVLTVRQGYESVSFKGGKT
jgi:nucleotide-binding universal stress UspA family protein